MRSDLDALRDAHLDFLERHLGPVHILPDTTEGPQMSYYGDGINERNAVHQTPRQPDYGFDVLSESFQGMKKGELKVIMAGSSKGPSTYLHAGAGKGWPHDQKAEDTFDLPPQRLSTEEAKENYAAYLGKTAPADPEYYVQFGPKGEALLMHYTPNRTIATFDTFTDAVTAAKALNELKGY
jgi:hypothetical protein